MRKKKIDAFPYLMCLAAVVLFTLFVVLPFAVGVYTSFFKWDGFSDMKFNGLKNYLYVFQDDIYWKAIKNTFVYAILVTVLKNVIAFFLASILVKNFFGRTFFRTAAIPTFSMLASSRRTELICSSILRVISRT